MDEARENGQAAKIRGRPLPEVGDQGLKRPDDRTSSAPIFPPTKAASELRKISAEHAWRCHGLLPSESIVLLSALWKAGKTTWLSHLLRAIQDGREFCGRVVQQGRALVVTEESESRWAELRDALHLTDSIRFAVRPFLTKPSWKEWEPFVGWLMQEIAEHPADVVIFDTLTNLWYVRNENDASEVTEALMPLRAISNKRTLMLVHHLTKAGGAEGTGSRGSGALAAFVDVILELRRYNADDPEDRQRVLKGWGRYDEVPAELVVELTDEGYVAHGDRRDVVAQKISGMLMALLPTAGDGWPIDRILDEWIPGETPRKQAVLDALKAGIDAGDVTRDGAGKRGNPWRYHKIEK
jgi:hypothetical protein